MWQRAIESRSMNKSRGNLGADNAALKYVEAHVRGMCQDEQMIWLFFTFGLYSDFIGVVQSLSADVRWELEFDDVHNDGRNLAEEMGKLIASKDLLGRWLDKRMGGT